MRQSGLMDRASPTRVCMRVHVLPVALQSDFTPSFHPSKERAGGGPWALRDTGCVIWHLLYSLSTCLLMVKQVVIVG